MIHRLLAPVTFCFAVLAGTANAAAAGGTSEVASKGQPAYVPETWPKGAGDLVNDPARTSGWNSWFTEWPNDVNHYAFEIASSGDLNRVIAKLAAIKADVRQIRLSYLKEPKGLGWVTQVPEGNGIPVIFSIGDQAQVDQWYQHVRKPFGVMELTAVPEAVPPTLTIFVQNNLVKLDEVKIPEGIDVQVGYIPTVFHKFHTKDEKQRERELTEQVLEQEVNKLKESLDAASREAYQRIEAFVDSRKKEAAR